MLDVLGPRPDHESMDEAKEQIAELDSHLSRKLKEIMTSPKPPHVDNIQWRTQLQEKEEEYRKLVEDEKAAYKAVIQLDEMHDGYEKLLKDAERRLERIYSNGDLEEERLETKEDLMNEEVVGILEKAYGHGIERIILSKRGLKFLPEAFCRISGLLALDVSSNQLTVIKRESHCGCSHALRFMGFFVVTCCVMYFLCV